MNIAAASATTISRQPALQSRIVKSTQEQPFQAILDTALKSAANQANAAITTAAVQGNSQIIASQKLKKNQDGTAIDDSSAEETPSDTSVSKVSPKISSFLKGLLEETSAPLKNTDTTPKLYANTTPIKKEYLIAQLPTQPQAPIGTNNYRRRKQAPIAITQNGPMTVTPFQIFLDKAVSFFDMVSDMQNQSGTMTQEYIQGKLPLEEVILIRSKVSIALTFATTLVNQITQSFKEIQQMQI